MLKAPAPLCRGLHLSSVKWNRLLPSFNFHWSACNRFVTGNNSPTR